MGTVHWERPAEAIATPLDYSRAAWCEVCQEAYAPPKDWTDQAGIIMALKVWSIRHNQQKHPRRFASQKHLLHGIGRTHTGHDGRTDCR